MKTLAFILSFVIIILSIAPCCDLPILFEQEEAKTALDHSDLEENCGDECSPFYACSSCGGAMLTPLISFGTPTPTSILPSCNHKYLPSFTEGIDQNIWQPPKLS